jgi:two-component system cell cycle response regulator
LIHKRQLYADEEYIHRMKAFHEHYMPSNDILRPVMEMFLKMKISMIAPQHGSIIKKNIKEHILALRDLECGVFLNPIKRNLVEDGGYKTVFRELLKRFRSIYSKKEVLKAIQDIDIQVDQETFEVLDYNYAPEDLWDQFFEQIYRNMGISWLVVIEPYVTKFTKEYDISLPKIFEATLTQTKSRAYSLENENRKLKEINESLMRNIEKTKDQLIRCPVTFLYNHSFFLSYFHSEFENIHEERHSKSAFVLMAVDHMSHVTFTHNESEVELMHKNLAYILEQEKTEESILFKLDGDLFGCYIPFIENMDILEYFEKIRYDIEQSNQFPEKITVSMGIVRIKELMQQEKTTTNTSKRIFDIAHQRLNVSRSRGGNHVCENSEIEDFDEKMGKVLIIDSDEVTVDVIQTFLENMEYQVFVALDGEEALEIIEAEALDLIISEIMLPKMDGFFVREKVNMSSRTKQIPFILLSHLKNEDSIQRAYSLGIESYLQKPFMLSELFGIISSKLNRSVV